MTVALCFHCGETKFGAWCPCAGCGHSSCGNQDLDLLFTDHNISPEQLRELGQRIQTLQALTNDTAVVFWAFLEDVSTTNPDLMSIEVHPELREPVDALLRMAELPPYRITVGRSFGPGGSSTQGCLGGLLALVLIPVFLVFGWFTDS